MKVHAYIHSLKDHEHNRHVLGEDEQMVSDGWHSSKYILGSEDFDGVEFEASSTADTLE